VSELEVVRVKLLRPGARMPLRATEYSSGVDLYAALDGGTVKVTQHPVVVPTGIAMQVPPGLDAQIRPRSGLAKRGVLCTYCTLDADYRGELLVTLYAVAPDIEYTIQDGDRIAQLVITRLAPVAFEQSSELPGTDRGEGGHGSTGR
jgi:dUTP pyrophosphatase